MMKFQRQLFTTYWRLCTTIMKIRRNPKTPCGRLPESQKFFQEIIKSFKNKLALHPCIVIYDKIMRFLKKSRTTHGHLYMKLRKHAKSEVSASWDFDVKPKIVPKNLTSDIDRERCVALSSEHNLGFEPIKNENNILQASQCVNKMWGLLFKWSWTGFQCVHEDPRITFFFEKKMFRAWSDTKIKRAFHLEGL